ncbi:MAG: DUF389 domain-containing protein [Bacteroidota bacterium]
MEPKDPVQPDPEQNPEERMRRSFFTFLANFWEFFQDLTDLRTGMDQQGTIINIRNNKKMNGANAWLLMCSIMVASLGLDLNSPAVIIGAMLISPLMSPILGVGLSVGINDRDMLNVSLKSFGVSIAIALVTSFLYFKLTPLGTLTPEIEARTAPTFLDVLVAFFGGIAGIISGSRKDKSNAIPGVAIATALMPPLCVTGFGLANGEWEIMLNSFYLFFLNAVFVALATYLIVRFLDFPLYQYVDAKEKMRTQMLVLLVSSLLIIPSIFILSGVLREYGQRNKIEDYFEGHFDNAMWEIESSRERDSLEVKLFLFGDQNADSTALYRQQFDALQVAANLSIIQTNMGQSELEAMQENMRSELLSMIEADQSIEDEKKQTISRLQFTLDSLRNDRNIFKGIAREAKILFPDLESVSYAKMDHAQDTLLQTYPTLLLEWPSNKSRRSRQRDERKLQEYVKIRANLDTLILVNR